MGTVFALPHARTTDLAAELTRASESRTLYALTPSADATDIRSLAPTGRRAVLIGSERSGLSSALLDIAIPVCIPMAAGVDSLNAAAATAVACYALA